MNSSLLFPGCEYLQYNYSLFKYNTIVSHYYIGTECVISSFILVPVRWPLEINEDHWKCISTIQYQRNCVKSFTCCLEVHKPTSHIPRLQKVPCSFNDNKETDNVHELQQCNITLKPKF